MSNIPILFADEVTDAVMASYRTSNPAVREWVVIFGATGLVSVLALVLAVVYTKRRRRRKHHHSDHHSSAPAKVLDGAAEDEPSTSSGKRRRRRRSGRQHRPRNPTRAETGGLPPIRPQAPSEPQA
jgi:hypothetical protein